MLKDALQLRINELTAKREEIFSKIEPLREAAATLYHEIEELVAKLSEIERTEMSTAAEDEQIAFYLHNDGDSKGMDHYKAKEKFWENMGFMTSGYYPAIQQQGLQICLYQDKHTNEQTISAIRKVLPHMIPIVGLDETRDSTAMKPFKIFEHTLSEYGSYSLFYDEWADEWIVSIIAWHRRSDVYVSKSLEDVINFISENHSYDAPEEEDYDNDYRW